MQNRCYANRAWDGAVRDICEQYGIAYQGFSLLTANRQITSDPTVADMAQRMGCTPAQVVFAFAVGEGIIPLTGTTSSMHMDQDLQALERVLDEDDAALLQSAGL